MKVLMFDNFLPSNKYTLELSTELGSIIELSLLTKSNCGIEDRDLCFTVIPALYGRKNRNAITRACLYLRGLFAFAREACANDYDLIHVQSFKSEVIEMPFIRAIRHIADLPIIYTVHNVDPHEVDAEGDKRRQRWYQACSGLVFHNKASLDAFNRKYASAKDAVEAVIPHGAYSHIGSMRELSDRVDKVQSESTHFLFFGGIRDYKGLDLLLNAISKIDRRDRRRFEFLIAGSCLDPLIDIEKSVEKLGVGDCVKTDIRFIEDSELESLFSWADFALFPYKEIYGSGALLMAYTFGVPVVASNLPAFVEETSNGCTGLLFKAQDPDSLAEVLLRAQGSRFEQREAWRSAIHDLVGEKYCWQKSARETYGLYKEVLRSAVRGKGAKDAQQN